MSIRRQMIVVFGLVALLPLIAAGIIAQRVNQDRLRRDGDAQLLAGARRIATELDAFLHRQLEHVRQAGLLPAPAHFATLPAAARTSEQARILQLLRDAIVNDALNTTSCALLNRDGLNVADTAPAPADPGEAQAPWFREPMMTGRPFAAVAARAGEPRALWVSAPVRTAAGEIVGVLRTRSELAAVQQIVARAPEIAESAMVGAIVERDGRPLVSAGNFRGGSAPRLEGGVLDGSHAPAAAPTFWVEWSAAALAAGERDRAAVAALKAAPWWCVIAQPESAFNAPLTGLTRTMAVFSGLAFALVAVAVLVTARRLSRPIADLAAVVRRGASGDLAVVATENLPGEVGALAHDFNQLALRLRETLGELQRRVAEAQSAAVVKNAMLESALDGVIAMDHLGLILEFNPAAERVFGYTRAQAIGCELAELIIPPALRERHRRGLAHFMATGEGPVLGRRIEIEALRADGAILPVELAIAAFRVGTAPMFTAYLRDITNRKRAEAALRASEERFRLLLDHAPDAIIVYDADAACLVDCNAAAERLFKLPRETLLKKNRPRISPRLQPDGRSTAELGAAYVNAALAGERPVYPWTYQDADGRPLMCEVRLMGFPDPAGRRLVRGSIVDITARVEAEAARHRLEEQLWHAQKLEAVGTLAGGLAHDFNNILVGVIGNLELVAATLPANHASRRELADALQASLRARDLVGRILTMSRRQVLERRPTAVEPIVREALNLVRASVPANIALEPALAPGLPPVNCDGTQIHQIVVNLATNSAHAMRAHGGTLSISLENVAVTAALRAAHPQLSAAHAVCLTVRDTGEGMSAATLARIFEPFFTTKPVGEGSGLGLAVVRGIVQSLAGAIVVESAPAAGTTVRVYLPGITVAVASPAPDPSTAARKSVRIAVVDDEPSVRQVLVRSLELMGHTATAFSAGEPLLAALREDPSRFDAVIADFTMPQMDGVSLARAVTALRADLPIILASGNTLSLDWPNAQAAGVRGLLDKPFTFASLGAAVDRLFPAAEGGA